MNERENWGRNTVHDIRSDWKVYILFLLEALIMWYTPFSRIRYGFVALMTFYSSIFHSLGQILPLMLAVGVGMIFDYWYLLSTQLSVEVFKHLFTLCIPSLDGRPRPGAILTCIAIQIGVLHYMESY